MLVFDCYNKLTETETEAGMEETYKYLWEIHQDATINGVTKTYRYKYNYPSNFSEYDEYEVVLEFDEDENTISSDFEFFPKLEPTDVVEWGDIYPTYLGKNNAKPEASEEPPIVY